MPGKPPAIAAGSVVQPQEVVFLCLVAASPATVLHDGRRSAHVSKSSRLPFADRTQQVEMMLYFSWKYQLQ